MSRDQLTTQTAQHDAEPDANAVAPETHGLRPDLHAQIMRMSPADADQLASMLQLYPSLSRAILLVAASHMGNSAVQRAIQLENSWHAQGRAGSLSDDELRASGGEVEPTRVHGDAMPGAAHHATDTAAGSAAASAPRAPAGKPPAGAHEPAWVAGARAYNTAHAHLVSQFNDLTAHRCLDDDSGLLDPQAVAKWQAHHGIPADGRVGPETVATANGPSTRTSELVASAGGVAPGAGAPGAEAASKPAGAGAGAEAASEPAASASKPAAASASKPDASSPEARAMHHKARAFNAAHPDLVREFNELTDYQCLDDDSAELDPHAVARWQLHHGEPADGMITADTIAVARAGKPRGSEVAASRDSDAAPIQRMTAPAEAGRPEPAERLARTPQLASRSSSQRLLPTSIQARASRGGGTPAVHTAAAEGISGPAGPLPHFEHIQRSFGHHDVSQIQAHVGGPATAGAQAMGAEAFATGQHVAFASAPSLHIAAHEAAHVVQQRGGVQLAGGVGQIGDAYEQHADAVADKVVRGESAEALLDEHARGAPSARPGATIQRRVWIDATREGRRLLANGTLVTPERVSESGLEELLRTSTGQVTKEDGWGGIKRELEVLRTSRPEIFAGRHDWEAEVKAKFEEWVELPSSYENRLFDRSEVVPYQNPEMADYTEDRVYAGYHDLAVALVHESDPKIAERLQVEKDLARQVADDRSYEAEINGLAAALSGSLSMEEKEGLEVRVSRYQQFSSLPEIKDILADPGRFEMVKKCILIDEISEFIRGGKAGMSGEFNSTYYKAFTAGDRINGHTLNEQNEWVRSTRQLRVPLQSGPSGTTSRICGIASQVGFSQQQIYKIAWCMFAFYNGMWRGWSGTHRLHEVMEAAGSYVDLRALGYRPDMTTLEGN